MGVIQKQSFGSTFFLVVGIMLGFVTAGILLPNYFTKEENGLITLLNSYSLVYSQFVLLGLHTMIQRFYPDFKTQMTRKNDFLTLNMVVAFGGFLLFMLFYYISKPYFKDTFEKSPLFGNHYFLLVPLTFFTAFFYLFDTYSAAMLKSVRGFFLKDVLQRFLIIGLIVVYIYLQFSFSEFVVLYTVLVCLPTIILAFMLLGEKQIYPGLPNIGMYRARSRELASVAGYAVLTGITFVGITNIDAIMVERYLDLEQAGIYGRNMFFGVLISVPYRAIHKISSGVLSTAFKNEEMQTVRDVYYKSCTNQLIIAVFLFIGLWLNIDNVYKVIPESYASGKWVIFYIGLGNLITMAGGVNTAVISFSPFYRYNTYFLIILLVLVVVTNMIMIPLYGITGAAAATAISIAVYNFLMYIFLYRKYGFQPFNIKHLLIVVIGTAGYLAAYFIPEFSHFIVDIVVRSSVFVAIFAVVILLSKVSPELNGLIGFLFRKGRSVIKRS